MANNKITLYPSNWLYNAGVVGLLRILEFAGKNNTFQFNNDGSVEIERKVLEESYKLLVQYHKKELNEEFKIYGKNKRYPNYIQKNQEDFFKEEYIKKLSSVEPRINNKSCNWCCGHFLPQKVLDDLQSKFLTNVSYKKNKDSFIKFISQREVFQGIHIKELGGAITEMPNSFWNFKTSTPLCHLCSYLVIFHHLSFYKDVFINTSLFYLTWDLNKFIEKFFIKDEQYNIKKLFATSLLQWIVKRRALLGTWTMMNIEMIVKRRVRINNKLENIIDYYDLPYHITRILIDYEIANLIDRIGEIKIFNLLLDGKFSELEKANYFILRTLLKIKNKERISENDPVKKYISESKMDINNLYKISLLLSELYTRIMKILKTEVGYG
ncbi:MAG: hypothetical protein N3D17_03435 [bacterium]|nr:hypothetical protein [bacterium]